MTNNNNMAGRGGRALPANLLAWATQLKQLTEFGGAVADAQREDWSLCGHAVLLEVDEPDTTRVVLQDVAAQSGMALLDVAVADVVGAADGWMQALAAPTPTIAYLTPGAWMGGDSIAEFLMGADPGVADDDACRQFRDKLIAFLSDTVHAHPVVLVTGIGASDMLHVALRQVGLFDRRIKVARTTDAQLTEEFIQAVGEPYLGPSLRSDRARLARLLRHEYPKRRRRALMQRALRRQAWAEGRPVEMADLLRCAAYGTAECAPVVVSEDVLWSHAVHEAGHAVVEHLDSVERKPPSYCSILTGVDSLGVVVPNAESIEIRTDDALWRDVTHRLRACLGGRAAEQVVLGLERLSAVGSRTDLDSASRLAGRMVAIWGLPLGDASLEQTAENLLVWAGEPSLAESAHADLRVRRLLQEQYGRTLRLLEQHRDYLLRIAQALLERTVLLQEDLERLWQECSAANAVAAGSRMVETHRTPSIRTAAAAHEKQGV